MYISFVYTLLPNIFLASNTIRSPKNTIKTNTKQTIIIIALCSGSAAHSADSTNPEGVGINSPISANIPAAIPVDTKKRSVKNVDVIIPPTKARVNIVKNKTVVATIDTDLNSSDDVNKGIIIKSIIAGGII